ncbi:pilus assembly protein PilP, partial [Pseudomonas sp. MWU13-2860]
TREALENYDLDKLAVVGVIRRSGTNYGLVRTPEGAVYRVQAGNYVGPHFGRIKKIGDTEIELTETVEDLNGEWVQRNTSLYLDEQGQNK